MSKLAQLQGKPKVYKIGEIELTLKPLKLDDMNLFNVGANSSPQEQMEATKKLITKTLKEAVPDATDEEINNTGMQCMNELMEAIMDVNGLKDKGVNIKDVIKARQAQAANKGQQ